MMPADRLLSTLLRSLQTYTSPSQQDTPRLLSTAASLLTSLSNPRNVSLLTTHLLSAPALWAHPDGLRTTLSLISVFHSAANKLLRDELEAQENGNGNGVIWGVTGYQREGLKKEAWVRAVVEGLDDRVERWKHLIVLGGVLLGFAGQEEDGLDGDMRRKLSEGIVNASNLALAQDAREDELRGGTVVLVLNHCFPILEDHERAMIEYDRLLPILIDTAFFSRDGLESAYFLGAMDLDVVQVPGGRFNWPARSSSYHNTQRIQSRPLVSSFGSLSRLIAHAVENVRDSRLIQTVMEDLTAFSRSLITQWRQNKLSEVDYSEEKDILMHETVSTTLPALWKLLKTALFATVIVIRGVMGRVLNDGYLASNSIAPIIATQALHTLRSLYFISSRMGPNSFSQHTFVYLTAMDILSSHAPAASNFLHSIRPSNSNLIPTHPLDRALDLYFLNTAEHFTLVLPPSDTSDLLLPAAAPYLVSGLSNKLLPLFEAAHSVMLSIFSAPQNAELTAAQLPFYVDALFAVFPQNLSPRQFRLAFKTLMNISTPPAPLSSMQPDLAETLLELLHHRAVHASTTPLQADPVSPVPERDEKETVSPLSEQAVLVLTLLDVLPTLPVPLLEEWLQLSAELVNSIPSPEMRDAGRRRLWEVLVSGEMDPERSLSCVSWWGTRGGREAVMFGARDDGAVGEHMMSGGNGEGEERESKL